MNQLPASLFILNLQFLKIFETSCRSSNALWTKSFYQAIKLNMNVLLRTRQTCKMFAYRKTRQLIPLSLSEHPQPPAIVLFLPAMRLDEY